MYVLYVCVCMNTHIHAHTQTHPKSLLGWVAYREGKWGTEMGKKALVFF